MDKSKNKKAAIIVIVAILALGAVLIPVLTSSDGDNTGQNNQGGASDQMADTPDISQSQPPGGGGSGSDDAGGEASDMPTTTAALTETVGTIAADGRDLEAELDGIIAAGCGDDLEAFNQRVVATVTSLGSWQESLVGAFSDPAAQPGPDFDPDLASLLADLQTLSQSIDAKHAQVAELSNSCNSQ